MTELLARTGMRRGELLDLSVDAVVQIGSAYWHPQLKELLDDWVANHRATDVRSDRLLIERNRPVTPHRIAKILRQPAANAGIGHVTAPCGIKLSRDPGVLRLSRR